ncbi:MAG: DUF4097 domain-containing protein [Gemmatimonadota bacterium]|nr:DUF4097 domain-containing protein [Gemmatimonadota bacterium]MDH4350010.1 DUF4097 domain-containing protein [Gemmatimonadota bacterium]
MMLTTATLAIAALAGLQQQQTDTTFAVAANARLRLSNHAGTVRVTGGDQATMRVRATHGSRDHIAITTRGTVIHIEAERDRGMPNFVEYEVTVPRGMAVELDGVETEMTVEGVGGDLSVASVEGGITVRGAGAAVDLNTVEGDISLEGGRGRISVSGVEGTVTVTGARGDLTVETVEGDITLDGVESTNVDLSTVDGDIVYRGTVQDGGRYRLTSHDGDIELGVATGLNATVSVATFDGSFEADPAFRVQISEVRPGRRFSFTLGTGSARVELETFDGEIRLRSR